MITLDTFFLGWVGFYVPCSRGQFVIAERVALYLEFLIFILVVIALGNASFL